MKTVCSLILSAVVLWGCASTPRPASDKEFSAMDTNGDGLVTWTEYQKAYPDADRDEFVEFDENRDDALDVNECRAGFGYQF